MPNYLTTARRALIAALQADPTLASSVRTWYDFGPGLRKRYDTQPSNCPLIAVVPAELDVTQIATATESLPQDVEVGITTDGQDAEPCEALVVAALDVVRAQRDICLGLAADGLTHISIQSLRWEALLSRKDARVRWDAIIIVRIHWMRRTA